MRSILIVVFDGLQPSQVTTQLMPNLASFAAEGVTFANHHAVFPNSHARERRVYGDRLLSR